MLKVQGPVGPAQALLGPPVAVYSRIGENSVTDASTYQDFFVVLDKAMFLTLHKVD